MVVVLNIGERGANTVVERTRNRFHTKRDETGHQAALGKKGKKKFAPDQKGVRNRPNQCRDV